MMARLWENIANTAILLPPRHHCSPCWLVRYSPDGATARFITIRGYSASTNNRRLNSRVLIAGSSELSAK